MVLVKQMIIFFLLMLIGYGMGKRGIIDEKVSKSFSWLIVNVANPALILSGSIGTVMERMELLRILALATVLFLVLILVAELLIPFFHLEQKDAGVYKVLLIFSNMGFMGFPIISALYGQQALLYAAVFLLPFNLLIYSYGNYRISGKKMKLKEAVGKILNIGLLAGVLSLVLAIGQIQIPTIMEQLINMLSGLTAPLCMIVIGASFVKVNFRDLFYNAKLIFFSLIKLLIIPLLGMVIIRMFVDDAVLQGICYIVLACPCGSMGAMLAEQNGGNYITASEGVAVTTLFSVVTMPLLFAMIG